MSGSRIRLVDTSAKDAPAAKAAGFRAGAELREARERLGWDLGEVAAALRIKLAYLQAIEDGRISALPGNAYALGFLRTYATTLGLDPDELTRRFRAEAGDVNRKPDLAFPAPAPERGVPTGALVLIGLLIAAAGYGAWYKLSDHEQTPTHTVPPVPDSLLPARRAAPVSPQVASVLPPPGSAVPTLPPRSVAAPAPAPAPVPTQAGSAAPATSAPLPVPVPTPSAVLPSGPATAAIAAPAATVAAPSAPPAAAPVPTTTAATPAAPQGVVLHASAVTWVQVRAPDHHVLWDHVMQPGDTWPVPASTPGLTLTTGNAGGLTLTADGHTTPSLGRNGSVRRNVPLDAPAVDALSSAPATAPPPQTVPNAASSATPVATGPTPTGAPHPATPRHRHVALPPPGSAEDTADQLNARQLGTQAPAPAPTTPKPPAH